MKTIGIIQARMSSTRLPGKVLRDICGKPMIARVLDRVRAAKLIREVVVAAPVNPADDPLAEVCAAAGTPCFRGSEEDVLDRYYRAAEHFGADPIVRITADCPLVDPQVIDQVVLRFQEARMDYCSNRIYESGQIRYTYPDGLDTEVIGFAALHRCWAEARLSSEREHVTAYIWKHPELFRLGTVRHAVDLSALRWTVDREEDLELVRAIYERLGRRVFSMQDVLALLEREPELRNMNSHIPLNEGYHKSLHSDGQR